MLIEENVHKLPVEKGLLRRGLTHEDRTVKAITPHLQMFFLHRMKNRNHLVLFFSLTHIHVVDAFDIASGGFKGHLRMSKLSFRLHRETESAYMAVTWSRKHYSLRE